MKYILKNTMLLGIITLVAGAALGFVYELTKEPIAEAKEKAKAESFQEVFSEADSFEAYENFQEETAKSLLQENGYDKTTVDEVVVAKKEEQTIGYVLTVTNSEGYSGEIQFAMGVQLDGSITGISFLSIGESPGLGMEAKEDQSWREQFIGKLVEQFTVTKETKSEEGQIEAISGATITSNAVTHGVNGGLLYFERELKGGEDG